MQLPSPLLPSLTKHHPRPRETPIAAFPSPLASVSRPSKSLSSANSTCSPRGSGATHASQPRHHHCCLHGARYSTALDSIGLAWAGLVGFDPRPALFPGNHMQMRMTDSTPLTTADGSMGGGKGVHESWSLSQHTSITWIPAPANITHSAEASND